VFKTLREKGVLAKSLRFQVSLPSVISALPPRIFPNPADVAKIRPGYTDALAAEFFRHFGMNEGDDAVRYLVIGRGQMPLDF